MKKRLTFRPGQGILVFALLLFFFTSCKKKGGPGEEGPNPPDNKELSDADSLKYLMYRVMQKTVIKGGRDTKSNVPLYYWYKMVPALDPLSAEYKTANDLLQKMKSYTRDNTGKPLDRYSFLDDGKVVGEIGGTGGDIGIQATYVRLNATDILPVVLYVDKNSSASKSNVQRGWIITSAKGRSAQYDGSTGANVTAVVDALFNDAQATFTFRKPDATDVTLTLAKSEYAINPILFDTVYSVGGKNVGYFVFNSFTDVVDDNGSPSLTRTEIDRVMNSFSGKNISDLIVDLRYNGGGEVRTAQYLANKIAPATANGQLMYKYEYNDLYGPALEEIGRNTKVLFTGGGNLNLNNVFFIGTRSTASASELLYNSLRPWMNTKLIGDTTYGKPVGAEVRPITTFKNNTESLLAYLIAITFETKNAQNQGGYYHGLVPDELAIDYVNVPWGNVNDQNLEKIFSFIATGSYGRSVKRAHAENYIPIPNSIPALRFNGMIETKDKH